MRSFLDRFEKIVVFSYCVVGRGIGRADELLVYVELIYIRFYGVRFLQMIVYRVRNGLGVVGECFGVCGEGALAGSLERSSECFPA